MSRPLGSSPFLYRKKTFQGSSTLLGLGAGRRLLPEWNFPPLPRPSPPPKPFLRPLIAEEHARRRQVRSMESFPPSPSIPFPSPAPAPSAPLRGILKTSKGHLPKASGCRVSFGDVVIHETEKWLSPRRLQSKFGVVPPPPTPPTLSGILKTSKGSSSKTSGCRVSFGSATVHEVERWIIPRRYLRSRRDVVVPLPVFPEVPTHAPGSFPPVPPAQAEEVWVIPPHLAPLSPSHSPKNEPHPRICAQHLTTQEIPSADTSQPRPFGKVIGLCALVAAVACVVSDLWW